MRKESKELEFKESFSNSFLKTVSAFANERTGKIIFGIADNGDITGIEQPEELRLRIENSINDNIQPAPKFELQTQKIDNKEIVVLVVYQGVEPPYFYKGQSYRRNDTSSVAVDRSQLKRWIMEADNIQFDRQLVNQHDFEFSILESALKTELKIESVNEDTLKTMGLMQGDQYTKAGELFADKNNISVGIDSVRFGRNISEFLKRKTLVKISLLEQYHQMLAFFDEFYYEYEEVSGFSRVKRVMIPREAFREALANAIVHKDYLIHANIKISLWEDYIEIISPGGLPKGITEEQFQKGRISILRNEVIASVFQRLNIIETFATGIKRIKDAYLEYPEEPKFEVYENCIIVKLPRINYHRKEVSDLRTDEIIKFLEGQPRTSLEIQEKLKLGKTKVNEHLAMLQNLGKIEKIGKARGTKYRLLKYELDDEN